MATCVQNGGAPIRGYRGAPREATICIPPVVSLLLGRYLPRLQGRGVVLPVHQISAADVTPGDPKLPLDAVTYVLHEEVVPAEVRQDIVFCVGWAMQIATKRMACLGSHQQF